MTTLSLSLFAFLVFTLTVVKSHATGGDPELYMYSVLDPLVYFPVKEYVGPKVYKTGGNYTPPAFLTDKSAPNRVVEYYAPWCPHCQHFKHKYIELARTCTAMAKHHGVDIEFHAVSCTANGKVCENDKDVNGYPSIILYPAGNSTGTKVSYGKVHCFTALKIFGFDLQEEELERPDVALPAFVPLPVIHANSTETVVKQKHDGRSKKQIYDDAFLSFDFAMRHSIYMSNGPLSDNEAEVFENWVELLSNALPFSWKIHSAIDAIADDLEATVKDEGSLLAIMDKNGPSTKKWSPGCPGGYTCGLWEIFHIMSIGVVEWNMLAPSEAGVITSENAADALHAYISEFFACDVCRRNFLEDYDVCKHDRCNRLGSSTTDLQEWKQLPLWLWEAHNDVLVRLMHERAERENRKTTVADEIAVQWPSRTDCPMCWHSDGTWDDEIIYKYLRVTYWNEDSVSDQYRKDLKLHHETKQELEKLMGDDAFEEEQSEFPFVAMVITFVGVMLAGTMYFLRKAKIARTGRHKKVDYS